MKTGNNTINSYNKISRLSLNSIYYKKVDGYTVKYKKYCKSSKNRKELHLKLLKNENLCRAILIVIRVLNPDRNPDNSQILMA